MDSVKLEIEGACSVLVMILDNNPRDSGAIPLEVIRVDKELIYVPKLKFDNDEFCITRVRYIEVQLYVIDLK